MMRRALAAATRGRLRDALVERALDPALLGFIEAVVLQTARPLGSAPRRGIVRREVELAERVIALIEACTGDGQELDPSAAALAAEPPLLSAFFQNLDLLPPSGSAPADAVALLVVIALGLLEETR